MAMKNYAKQLNSQIEEVVTEVTPLVVSRFVSHRFRLDSKSIG